MTEPITFDGMTVCIAGAGATRGAFSDRPFPPPVDGDFFERTRQMKEGGIFKRAKGLMEALMQVFNKTDHVGMEECYRDFETRKKIVSIAKAGGRPKAWSDKLSLLSDLIQRTYAISTSEPSGNRGTREGLKSWRHRKLINRLKAKDVVITFNYDLVFEESCDDPKAWNPNAGYGNGVSYEGMNASDWIKRWKRERKISHLPKSSKITLLKLHGSLNWEKLGGNRIKIKPRPYYVVPGSRVQEALLLFPTWNKEGIETRPFNLIWPEARKALQRAKNIVIIGYSLPETDLLAKALFGEVVRHRRDSKGKDVLEKVVVADPSRDVRKKWFELFRPLYGPYTRLFEFESFDGLSRGI